MGRRMKQWNITGEIVPPGLLAANPYNRFARVTAEERWKSFASGCADIIADASLKRVKASVTHPKQT